MRKERSQQPCSENSQSPNDENNSHMIKIALDPVSPLASGVSRDSTRSNNTSFLRKFTSGTTVNLKEGYPNGEDSQPELSPDEAGKLKASRILSPVLSR